ncbi:laminin subunit gamma-1-like [Petromyzon marinus]|uniref:laminin subunit gamma-1-like n=1 Tax=Petromyzon marinus TaxID=7757 RepID=UPI003F6F30BE
MAALAGTSSASLTTTTTSSHHHHLIILIVTALTLSPLSQSLAPPPPQPQPQSPPPPPPSSSRCVDAATRVPRRCQPDFENAAYGREVIASATCGVSRPEEFCPQPGSPSLLLLLRRRQQQQDQQQHQQQDQQQQHQQQDQQQQHQHQGGQRSDEVARRPLQCQVCDARVPELSHGAELMTDLGGEGGEGGEGGDTWWQSPTMLHGTGQEGHPTTLTLQLGKAFELSYVRLRFVSSRPESVALFKRPHVASVAWQPLHYFSASCAATYGIKPATATAGYDEEEEEEDEEEVPSALCTDQDSDISPLTGASVAFSTLEGRRGAQRFDRSPALQEWVTVTELRVSLDRLNTFGDELFGDPSVLRSYYYAVSQLDVGARCKCNGHGDSCVWRDRRLVCSCHHHTEGDDCERCAPTHHGRPWARATASNAHECLPCECQGLAARCEFDPGAVCPHRARGPLHGLRGQHGGRPL